jgi:phosphotriesterase-related protein
VIEGARGRHLPDPPSMDSRHLRAYVERGWVAAESLKQEHWALETSYYPYNPAFDMPNDGGRMRHVLALIERGHADQILMSHDIAYKHCLTKYGGYGYHHLLVNVVPRLRDKGADAATIRRLLVDNPRRAFVFA